jgi:hypothetical protein
MASTYHCGACSVPVQYPAPGGCAGCASDSGEWVLCQSCLAKHAQGIGRFKDHLAPHDADSLLQYHGCGRAPTTCSVHIGMPLTLFCSNDARLCCANCATTPAYAGKQLSQLPDASSGARSWLWESAFVQTGGVTKASDAWTLEKTPAVIVTSAAVKRITDELAELNGHSLAAKHAIVETCDALLAAVSSLRADLNARIDAATATSSAALKQELPNRESQLSQTKALFGSALLVRCLVGLRGA